MSTPPPLTVGSHVRKLFPGYGILYGVIIFIQTQSGDGTREIGKESRKAMVNWNGEDPTLEEMNTTLRPVEEEEKEEDKGNEQEKGIGNGINNGAKKGATASPIKKSTVSTIASPSKKTSKKKSRDDEANHGLPSNWKVKKRDNSYYITTPYNKTYFTSLLKAK